MNQKHREILDTYCEDIVPKIDLPKLWPKLLEYKIYNRDDVNIPRWIGHLREEETVKDVYLTIKTRGPHAFENFLLSLRQTGHEKLAEILENPNIEYYNNNIKPTVNGRVPTLSNLEDQKLASQWNDNFYHNMQISSEPLKIKVQKALEFLDEPTKENIQKYPMRSKPRGLVLIITNIHFEFDHEPPRKSAAHDETNLKQLFEDMGFDVITYRDLTAQKLEEKVRAFASNPDLRKVDSCFVIITSHGKQNDEYGDTEIQGTDYHPTYKASNYKKILCTDILNFFTSSACPYLERKPKIFIFQLCRGDKKQKAVRSSRHITDSCSIPETSTDHLSLQLNTIRTYTDMLVAHATMPGYVAFRDKITGSWFIQILCEVFMNYACTHHVHDLLNMVDNRLEHQRTMNDECQTLQITSIGFSKHCYLNPGLFQK